MSPASEQDQFSPIEAGEHVQSSSDRSAHGNYSLKDEEDDDNDTTDTDEEGDDRGNIEKTIDTAAHALAQGSKNDQETYSLENQDDYTKFEKKFRSALNNPSPDNNQDKRNILHQLLEKVKDRSMHAQSFKVLVKKHPHLIEHAYYKQTPLFLALNQNKPKIASAMLEGFKASNAADSMLHRVLEMQHGNETCLHLALRKNLVNSAIKDLVSVSSAESLCIQDERMMTPLHHAVNYGDCGAAGRVETIQRIIEMSRKSLSMPDHLGHSAFEHHIKTKKEYLAGIAEINSSNGPAQDSKQAQPKIDTMKDKQDGKPVTTPKDRDQKTSDAVKQTREIRAKSNRTESRWDLAKRDIDPKKMDKEGEHLKSADGLASMKRDQLRSHSATGRVRFGPGARRDPEHVEVTALTGLLEGDEGSRGEEKHETKQLDERINVSDKKQKKLEREAEKERTRKERERARKEPQWLEEKSKQIQLSIKLQCMREMSPEQTSRVLYGNDNPDEIQIYFDFEGPSNIIFNRFKDCFSHVRFDEVLQYVALPSVTFEQPDEERARDNKRQSRGSKDLIAFFKWLRKEKKVTHIMKVIVNDYQKTSHSDEAIEKSLKDFHVEELHWLRNDMNPGTICAIGSDIREIYLRWSGSNTALWAWGASDGLRSLEKLDTVYLELIREVNLESQKRTNENVQRFKEKMLGTGDSSSRRITVNEVNGDYNSYGTTQDTSSRSDGTYGGANNHKWLTTIDKFSGEMQQMWEHATQRTPKMGEPIVVALLDDGVDVIDQSLQGRKIEGKTLSFELIGDDQPKTRQRAHPHYVSAHGHGTVMANMIFRVCPMAKLYVIRLETHINPEGKNKINPKSAAAAIQAAVARGVNIISMSWTVSADEGEGQAISEAVRAAHNANILMFCSSSDDGHFTANPYPSAVNKNWFFRIGAAHPNGMPFSWAGSVENLTYILPGVEVVKYSTSGRAGRELLKERLEAMPTETGSSVATALAAGLAALILSCTRIAAIYDSGKGLGFTRKVVQEMQKHENMQQAFQSLGVTNHKFVQVWTELDIERWENYDNVDQEGKWRMLTGRMRNIVPSKLLELHT